MSFPRVLLVALARINEADSANNGLLLRNLFATWPRENLAQIYSSGDNGDRGFLGHYYQLGNQDRWLGPMFYKLKSQVRGIPSKDSYPTASGHSISGKATFSRSFVKRLLVDTGLYELIFRPRLSREMLRWVKGYKPDVIFAQGYCLTFSWLPVMLKMEIGAKLAFLTTDDWPTYLYSGRLGEPRLFKWLMRYWVRRATRKLMAAVDIPIAFGQPMADEYTSRYGKKFVILSHADDPRRFSEAVPLRSHPQGTYSILATGNFNCFRWPLLLDANECCRKLHEQGIEARVAVFFSTMDPEGRRALQQASYLDLHEDPGNERLPGYLKAADVLLLAEGFDEDFVSAIRLSVSSKAHLFMFSGRPVIVYAHAGTGISKYASKYGWGRIVSKRNVQELMCAIRNLILYPEEAAILKTRAETTVNTFHLRAVNEQKLLSALLVYSPTFSKGS